VLFLPRFLRKEGILSTTALVDWAYYGIIGVGNERRGRALWSGQELSRTRNAT
jgi:hypothetical protein